MSPQLLGFSFFVVLLNEAYKRLCSGAWELGGMSLREATLGLKPNCAPASLSVNTAHVPAVPVLFADAKLGGGKRGCYLLHNLPQSTTLVLTFAV